MADEEKRVDEDWKEKIEKERNQSPATEQGPEAEKAPGSRERMRFPAPTFGVLLSNLAAQALVGLGEIENPISGKKEKVLEQAKYSIDTIQMLADKTKGNLTDIEKRQVDNLLYDLRMRYVEASH